MRQYIQRNRKKKELKTLKINKIDCFSSFFFFIPLIES